VPARLVHGHCPLRGHFLATVAAAFYLQHMTPAVEADFALRVQSNQSRLSSALRREYDFVVCGAGSSGSVVARRLAENPDAHVLLVDAGGYDDVPGVTDPALWPANIGSSLDWGFWSEPNPDLDGRRVQMSMGKVLGGGSSMNAMAWSRGHRSDWDLFAAESGNASWGYQSVLDVYRRIEDWHGAPDPLFRGTGGEVFVQPAPDPHPVALAMLEATESVGIPTFENPNGRLMESDAGAALGDLRIRDGKRVSIFRSYTYPYMDRPNLTVLAHALVTRLTMEHGRATGVEIVYQGDVHRIGAGGEVILSLGAIHTPKVLMQSGVGDDQELRSASIPVVQHLPGVGRNLQDHTAFDCVWQFQDGALPPRNNGSETVAFGQTAAGADGPDMFIWQAETPLSTPENAARYDLPEAGWTMFSAIAHPRSRGRIRLTGADPLDPVRVELNALSDPEDLKTALACVQLSREIANSAPLRPHVTREVMPGDVSGTELESYVRLAARTFWHQTGTARMGRDEMSVVDGELKVHGIENLRVADGSIMPRITTGNTMAPCVVIGERAATELKAEHRI
jgi:choline dehydrogenase